MAAGVNSIEDMDLRHGAMPALFGGVRAPSTLARTCAATPGAERADRNGEYAAVVVLMTRALPPAPTLMASMLFPVMLSVGMPPIYQDQLPVARLVKDTSASVVVSRVLPPAIMSSSVFTGPVPRAFQTFTTAVEVNLPTLVTMIMVTSVAR